MHAYEKPAKPRNGRRWIILIVARISTVHQDRQSLDDQVALCKREAQRYFGENVEFIIIKSQVSGEYLDREELYELERLITSDKLDAIIVEDLGRICRRARAVDFCEQAEDHNTRLISINDHVDTHDGSWYRDAFFSAMHHEISNKDTSCRIQRTHVNRFDEGKLFQHPIYGFLKPDGKSHENDVVIDPEAKKVYDKWFAILEGGGNYGSVADWLNESRIPTGPRCRLKEWIPDMVARITKNTILKGVRVRNRRMSKRVNKTGRRKSIKAPAGMMRTRFCPHLAMIDPARYDRLIAKLTTRNAPFCRKLKDGSDPRAGVPRKRTRWPGQHLVCGVCGRYLHFGAHGQIQRLCCAGCRDHRCWNSASIDAVFARSKIIEAVFEAISSLSDFEPALIDSLTKTIDEFAAQQNHRLVEEQDRLEKFERQRDSIIDAIVQVRMNESLKARLTAVEADIASSKEVIEQLTDQSPETPALPTMNELKAMAINALKELAEDTEELGHLLRKWIPGIHVLPVQLLLDGKPGQRAFFTLDLTSFLPCKAYQEKFGHVVKVQMAVDLFEIPAREKLRPQIVKLKQEGYQLRQIAELLNTHLPTVQLALKLQQEMDKLGISNPILPIEEPPSNSKKWVRHQHVRFQFQPLPGYPLRLGD